jgi:hypothetical protein
MISTFPVIDTFPKDAPSLSTVEKQELVQRVLQGRMFRRAPAMCAFLLHITEQALSGHAENLKEQAIGANVLGRKGNYDPAIDNIVRVRAHELRERLDKHFSSEGAEEPVIITVPKGSYVPEFTPRKSFALDDPETPQILAMPVPSGQKRQSTHRYWLPFTPILLIAISATAVFTRYVLTNNNRARTISSSGAMHDFWGQFFERPDEELRIVFADTSFALWQDLSRKSLDLGDYLSRKDLELQSDELREVAARRSTSPADLFVSVGLGTVAIEFGGRLNLQFARNANVDFLHHGNSVLLGSRRSNPWLEVYENNLNFVLEQDPNTGAPLFRNRSPLPQEAQVYGIPTMLDVRGDEQREFTSYALVALLKGCGDRGLTVVDEGLNMQATQAAGDLITDPQRLDMLLRSIGHTVGTKVLPFEALIQIKSLPGGYEAPQVIAFRVPSSAPCVGN